MSRDTTTREAAEGIRTLDLLHGKSRADDADLLVGTLKIGSARGHRVRLADRLACYDYNTAMSAARPKPAAPRKTPPKPPILARGLPGSESDRAEQRRRFVEEHRETLRRLGK
jgi:hypothetical protein